MLFRIEEWFIFSYPQVGKIVELQAASNIMYVVWRYIETGMTLGPYYVYLLVMHLKSLKNDLSLKRYLKKCPFYFLILLLDSPETLEIQIMYHHRWYILGNEITYFNC